VAVNRNEKKIRRQRGVMTMRFSFLIIGIGMARPIDMLSSSSRCVELFRAVQQDLPCLHQKFHALHKAVLKLASVLEKRERQPIAVFPVPMVLLLSASSPRKALKRLESQPSLQIACAPGKNAKQARASGVSKASRQGKRFIESLNRRVVVFIMRRGLQKSGQLGKTNWDAVIPRFG
jgi:hypothetical protein